MCEINFHILYNLNKELQQDFIKNTSIIKDMHPDIEIDDFTTIDDVINFIMKLIDKFEQNSEFINETYTINYYLNFMKKGLKDVHCKSGSQAERSKKFLEEYINDVLGQRFQEHQLQYYMNQIIQRYIGFLNALKTVEKNTEILIAEHTINKNTYEYDIANIIFDCTGVGDYETKRQTILKDSSKSRKINELRYTMTTVQEEISNSDVESDVEVKPGGFLDILLKVSRAVSGLAGVTESLADIVRLKKTENCLNAIVTMMYYFNFINDLRINHTLEYFS